MYYIYMICRGKPFDGSTVRYCVYKQDKYDSRTSSDDHSFQYLQPVGLQPAVANDKKMKNIQYY